MYKVYSTAYLSHDVSTYTCAVNEREWIRLHNDFSTGKMFVRIMKDDRFWICALDSPIPDVADNCIYVPNWMLDQIGGGDGETMHVEFMPSEAFDHSEKIVLQAWQENTEDFGDIQEILSNELTKLAILQKGTTITVNLYGLDFNYTIIDLEPASVVLCEGDEVELEFYEEPPMPSAPVLEPVVEPLTEAEPVRFNPWRNKDFKPYMS